MAAYTQNLPTTAGTAAFTYSRDPETGKLVPTSQGLGPIFGDRAQTLGKGKLNFGVDWSHISYDEFEGTNLRDSFVYTRPSRAIVFSGRNATPTNQRWNRSISLTYTGPDSPAYPEAGVDFDMLGDDLTGATDCTRGTEDTCAGTLPGGDDFRYNALGPDGDYNAQLFASEGINLNVHLDVERVGLYVSYGLTDTIDIGVVVPWMENDLGIDVDYFVAGVPTLANGSPDWGWDDRVHGRNHPNRNNNPLHYPPAWNDPNGPNDPVYGGCYPDSFDDKQDRQYYEWCSFAVGTFLANSDEYDGQKDANDPGAQDPNGYNEAYPVNAPEGAPDGGLLFKYGINKEGNARPSILTREVLSGWGDDSGLGDVIVRGKWNFLQSPAIDMSGRVAVQFPTGDKDNFRGTDEFIFNTTLIASKSFDWFAPHINLGLDWSPAGSEYTMFRWAAGASARLHERATASVTFVGSKWLDADGIDDTQMSVVPGVKIRLWRNFLLKTSVLIQVNHQGLQADVIPNLGIEYTFF
jgi:hypothetical protein